MRIIKILFWSIWLMMLCTSQELTQEVNYEKVDSIKDWEQLVDNAKVEHTYILLYFSGSDWCNNCYALHKNVLNRKEFQDAIYGSVYMVNIDFPQVEKTETSNQAEVKDYLAATYNPEGIFPRLILLDAEKTKVSELLGYRGASISEVLQTLKLN